MYGEVTFSVKILCSVIAVALCSVMAIVDNTPFGEVVPSPDNVPVIWLVLSVNSWTVSVEKVPPVSAVIRLDSVTIDCQDEPLVDICEEACELDEGEVMDTRSP